MKEYEITITKKIKAHNQTHAEMLVGSSVLIDADTVVNVQEDYLPFD